MVRVQTSNDIQQSSEIASANGQAGNAEAMLLGHLVCSMEQLKGHDASALADR